MKNEIWKPVQGFSNYAVSNFGSISRLKNGIIVRILKVRFNNYGYHRVSLYQNNVESFKLVHRLVYENFVGEIPNGMVVDHIDGVKTNNRITNLRVCTIRENSEYYYDSISKEGSSIGVRFIGGKWEARTMINKKRRWLGSFDTLELAKEAYQNVRKIVPLK